MREAYHRISQVYNQGLCHTAAFFFDAKGDKLLHSPEGLYRSLLCQLLPRRRDDLRNVVEIYEEKVAYIDRDEGAAVSWDEMELRNLFQGLFEDCSSPHTILFIDALDECEGDQLRELAFFF
jgi:protein SERAC1